MPRKGYIAKREVLPDPVYQSKVVTKLINNVMESGKKSLANPIPSPIINRLAKFNVTVNFDTWKKQFAIPNNVNKKIIHFLSNPKYAKYFKYIKNTIGTYF